MNGAQTARLRHVTGIGEAFGEYFGQNAVHEQRRQHVAPKAVECLRERVRGSGKPL